jgi:amino acid transporter
MSSPPMEKPTHQHVKLGQAYATAICGNDILSSCLYVSGIAILFSGVYAPLILLVIGFILYLYKKVYTEVVEALPVNGGAYNCLLNGTSKTIAACAGVMTFLSYIATAVISAKVGIEYLNRSFPLDVIFPHSEYLPEPVIQGTILLLGLFALLVISGIKDSAKVAFGIFVTHIATISLFVILGAYYYMSSGASFFMENAARTDLIFQEKGGMMLTLYLAFSASLLGVSGFESSANFVEEQKKGVFRLTLRNMLLGVAIFNPLIALVVLNVMPYGAITEAKDFLLADAASVIGGVPFVYLVVVDAFLVLSGAVLTSYVGVSGLMHRMSGDACIPAYFGKENKKGSFPRIIVSFFLLCSSILLMTGGDLLSLAGVYTIAFLGVMSLFALGNLILRETRSDLKRTYHAPFFAVIVALLATTFGMIGNIRIDPRNLTFFEIYFIPSITLVLVVIYKDYILKFFKRITQRTFPKIHRYIEGHFSDLTEGKFVAFIHKVERLRPILQYIDRNETGWNIVLVHCDDGGDASREIFEEIHRTIPVLQKAGFFPHFRISLMQKRMAFGPEAIEVISKELDIRKNRILIGSIHGFHDFEYDSLGGARIIFE